MRRNIVLMAKSKKGKDGYCVSGIDTDNGAWIRLNVRGYYSIPRNLFKYPDGDEPELLDVISVELVAKDNSERFQPENFYSKFDFQRTPYENIDIVLDRLDEDYQHDEVFYNEGVTVDSDWLFDSIPEYYSLMIIEPQDLVFYKNDDKVDAYFYYKGKQYRGLRVTDLEFLDTWEEHTDGAFFRAGNEYVLVISLGLPYAKYENSPEKCWKLIASVIHKSWLGLDYEEDEDEDADPDTEENDDRTEPDDDPDDYIVDEELYERLRKLRNSIAEQEGLPAYCIFSNQTLEEMSSEYPVDEDEFLAINGVGERKLEKYGEKFLKTIKDYLHESADDDEYNEDESEYESDQLSLIELLDDISDGVDPISGEILDEDALSEDEDFKSAISRLYRKYVKGEKEKPSRAGEPWSVEEDDQLEDEFFDDMSVLEMAESHNRTKGAIIARLQKLGLLDE